MTRQRQALALAAAWVLVLGCDDDDPRVAATIADILIEDGNFTVLATAVRRADLEVTLRDVDSATLFAPTDQAFFTVGVTREDVLAMPVPDLRRLLLYHVFVGRELFAGVLRPGPLQTSAELTLFLDVDGVVRINGGNGVEGGANVIAADLRAANGVIHAIDRVLLPPDVVDLARYGGLTALLDALRAAGLAGDLEAAASVTVFAPTNDAFAAFGALPGPPMLANVLRYHVLDRSLDATAIAGLARPAAETLATNPFGNRLTVVFDGPVGLEVNDSTVVVPDLRATNGTVHLIDSILVPPDVVEMVELADLTALAGALAAAAPLDGMRLVDVLAGPGPFTVFAPTNAAFAAIADTLATLTPAQIRDVLLFHVLDPARFGEPVLMPMLPPTPARLPTLNSDELSLTSRAPVIVEGARVVVGDISVMNGVIHVIDAVLIPDGR